MTGAFRSRNAALASTGALAWTHVVDSSRGAGESLRPPGAQPERGLHKLLESMDDLSGIEEP
jgi:hypothetical protein